jgi:threonine aldolase
MSRMDEKDERARRLAAAAGCERTLSFGKPVSMRDQLARLVAADRTVYDLDAPPDYYGDGIVRVLEERVIALLGMDDAVFFPTGTLAQQVALRCWAARTGNNTVALHPLSHPQVHERDALSAVSGLRPVHPTAAPRMPSAQEVREFPEPFGTLMLELPLRDAGFVLPTWDELAETVAAARERDAVVHFDGARLWECAAHFGRPPAEIAALADSVYVSFYKSLGGLSGAVLAGPADLVADARTWRHRYGGRMFSQWPIVLSALDGLERELPRLGEYVAHAKVVAEALREAFDGAAPWFRINPGVPHTHQFQIWLGHPAEALNEAGLLLMERDRIGVFSGWSEPGTSGLAMTEMTVAAPALEWSGPEVTAAARALLDTLR